MALEGPNQLLDFLRALKKRRWQVAVPAILVATLGIAFGVIVPKKYRLGMRIEISQTQRLESDRRLKDPRESATIREAPSAAEHVKSFTRIKRVIEDNIRLWPEYVALPDETSRALFIGKLIDENLFASSIDRNNRAGTIFVDIGFKDESPERAASFLSDLAESWLIEIHDQDLKTLMRERELQRDILEGYEQELDEAQARFYSLCNELQLDPTEVLGGDRALRDVTGDWTSRALDEAKSAVASTERLLDNAKTERDITRQRFEDEAENIAVPVVTAGPNLEARILEGVARADALRRELERLQPTHSQYKKKLGLLEDIEAEVQRLRDMQLPDKTVERLVKNEDKQRYAAQLREHEDEVARLEADLGRLVQEQERLEAEQRNRTLAKANLEEFKRDFQGKQQLVYERSKELKDKDDAYRVLEGSPKPWKISQPPVPAAASKEPNPYLIGAFAVVAGLALGVGIAVLSEYARGCYRSASDLAGVMSVPVLGTIDTIVTRGERRRRQAQRAMAGLSTAVIVGCIGWVTWLWASAPERLPVELQDVIDRLRTALK